MTVQQSVQPVWSKSQVAALAECRRKFFLNVKSSDKTEAVSPLLTQAPSLKKLTNRHLWVGSILHEEIGSLLKSVRQGNPLPSEEPLIDSVREKMRTRFRGSRESHPDIKRLFEHEYNVPIEVAAWQRHWQTVEQALHWFLGSKWLKRLSTLGPECWKAVDEILSFDVNGIKAFSKIDCGVETGGRFILIDWKTSTPGESSEAGLQVAALYAHEVWGAEVEQMEAVAVSILDGKTFHARISEDSLMETHLRIEEESSRLEEARANLGSDLFSIEPAGPEACRRCSYQRICYAV